ncbi:putative two-component response regulator ARR2-like [Sesbania bispinosa]|nr:putative two-component response regulator ARR2-like [Sesbania bispinosa]
MGRCGDSFYCHRQGTFLQYHSPWPIDLCKYAYVRRILDHSSANLPLRSGLL